ncbi:aminoacyl-histidine dipeptidase [Candidatus Uabimicrobium amorphum]|uniref:Cytosol non-specific dipeptidase n=1 Tax=Uabimicrobium amorphum TaxID=2596890 RepID=A0A5S9IL21_UABAM|nr:aminoacyl-histidine dipeptidase [Candidatus Uabimicrobium amorphum]BBM83321.1 aminoacyl-histidine dipeptidase [Candidatus Uabimicrobium amorphum]
MVDLKTLEPVAVWQHFDEIRQIPRSSKNEEAMRQYVKKVAERNNLSFKEDSIGNVVVSIPATPGKEDVTKVVLQSHLDMVCEKDPDTEHDFEKDAIQVTQKGEYLYAVGTTLGADNGIGVALELAVMEKKDWEHGPIECLFTIDEETGLTGAKELDPSIVTAKTLINLDTEEHRMIYVGCAGGGDTKMSVELEQGAVPENYSSLEVVVSGLKGGHSGCDIHVGKGNAIKILSRILWSFRQDNALQLGSISGGDKHNAIPRNAKATLVVPEDKRQSFIDACNEKFNSIKDEFNEIEPEMSIAVTDSECAQVLTEDASDKVLMLLVTLPHGVLAMNPDIKELVNTSNNLASVRCEEGKCLVLTSTRSSLKEALENVREQIAASGKLIGATVVQDAPYPGWKPDLSSPILQKVKEQYAKTFGEEPEVKAIHAGLECGVIGEKIPGMDMVSIGPQIENPHSPSERVHIGSVDEFWKVFCEILQSV